VVWRTAPPAHSANPAHSAGPANQPNPPNQGRQGRPPGPSAAPTVQADPGQPGAGYGTVPVFGRGARAHGFPWLTPSRTVQNGIAADQAQVGGLALRAASVVGPGHRCEEPVVPRQDAYRISRDSRNRYALVAVADGLSSGKHSELGANAAVSSAVSLLRDEIERGADPMTVDVRGLYATIADGMSQQAAHRKLGPRDIDAVMIAAVVEAPRYEGADAVAWLSWIGDVSAWILHPHADAWRFAAGDRKDGSDEMSSNAVSGTLPGTPERVETAIVHIPPGAALALVSDGVGDALASIGAANRYFAKAWANPPSVVAFLNDVSYDAERFIDDRTAVVVWNDRA
jgi:serine/threonine protein phosphatase PrpC